jgi:hypothetical protein
LAKIENCLEISGSQGDLAQLITEFYTKNTFILRQREDNRYFQLELNRLRPTFDEIELELWIKASDMPSTNLLIFSHGFPKRLRMTQNHVESIYQEILSLYQFISDQIPQNKERIDVAYEATVCAPEEEGDHPYCVICRRPVQENLIKTPCCGIYAHAPHLQEWLRMKGTCPLCRAKLKERDLFNEKEFEGKEEGDFLSIPWCPTCYRYKGKSSVCPHCRSYAP